MGKRKPGFKIDLNQEQRENYQLLSDSTISLITGKAGSGKTFLACRIALDLFLRGDYTGISITRPTISKEDLGHLPGTLEEKMEPWVNPIKHNMSELIGKELVASYFAQGEIDIVPVSYMRGRTFCDRIVIVDECQNLDVNQTLMLIQRLGVRSKMYFCGDDRQIDLKKKNESGIHFLNSITGINEYSKVKLETNNRHKIIDDIMDFYYQSK